MDTDHLAPNKFTNSPERRELGPLIRVIVILLLVLGVGLVLAIGTIAFADAFITGFSGDCFITELIGSATPEEFAANC